MARIIYITHFEPSEIGHGGNHRSYQVLHDIQSLFGADSVEVIYTTLYSNQIPQFTKRIVWKCITGFVRIAQRLVGLFWYIVFLGNVYYVLTHIRPIEKLGYRLKFFREIKQYYELLKREMRPDICIIDHPFFECFIDINQRYRIPTFICTHNLEAFDSYIYDSWTYKNAMYSSVLFADEYHCLSRCEERLVISKVEKTILDGVGIYSNYYAYVPVGKIRERQGKVRLERQKYPSESGLILMLGSYYHLTTAEGMDWLLENIVKNSGDLNNKPHIIVGGNGTHLLKEKFTLPSWIEVKGWISQDELDSLMIRAQAVLIPQRLGFGALTRLSELSCAGIPVVVSKHPTHALEIPPGVMMVNDRWEEWRSAIDNIMANPSYIEASQSSFDAWASRQENGLLCVTKKYLDRQMV